MNILYSSDDNYAEFTGISMLSLFENNKDAKEIHVYLLESGISEENKEKLLKITQLYERKIHMIQMLDAEEMAGTSLFISNHVSLSSFSRLFAARLLPDTIDKILYLDSDIIIQGSLKQFWESDMKKFMVSGVHSVYSQNTNRAIMLKNRDAYVNAGVLLINLKRWRDWQVEKKFIDFARVFNGKVPVEDQGILNGVLCKHIKLAHPKYNYTPAYHENDYKNLKKLWNREVYVEEIVAEAKENPVVLHYASEDKPWQTGYNGPYKNEFLHYKDISPWAAAELRAKILTRPPSPPKKSLKARVRCILPQILLVGLQVVMHQYRYYLHVRKLKKNAKAKGISWKSWMFRESIDE